MESRTHTQNPPHPNQSSYSCSRVSHTRSYIHPRKYTHSHLNQHYSLIVPPNRLAHTMIVITSNSFGGVYITKSHINTCTLLVSSQLVMLDTMMNCHRSHIFAKHIVSAAKIVVYLARKMSVLDVRGDNLYLCTGGATICRGGRMVRCTRGPLPITWTSVLSHTPPRIGPARSLRYHTTGAVQGIRW